MEPEQEISKEGEVRVDSRNTLVDENDAKAVGVQYGDGSLGNGAKCKLTEKPDNPGEGAGNTTSSDSMTSSGEVAYPEDNSGKHDSDDIAPVSHGDPSDMRYSDVHVTGQKENNIFNVGVAATSEEGGHHPYDSGVDDITSPAVRITESTDNASQNGHNAYSKDTVTNKENNANPAEHFGDRFTAEPEASAECNQADATSETYGQVDVQNFDIEVLPGASDEGVVHQMNKLEQIFNVMFILRCLGLMTHQLHIGVNVVARDAEQLIKVQELQFDLIKLHDAISLQLQNVRSGSNNILEKLKIAYLYLLDGFPDFARADIEAISQDVNAMAQATKACLVKLQGAKASEGVVFANLVEVLKTQEKKLSQLQKEEQEIMQKIQFCSKPLGNNLSRQGKDKSMMLQRLRSYLSNKGKNSKDYLELQIDGFWCFVAEISFFRGYTGCLLRQTLPAHKSVFIYLCTCIPCVIYSWYRKGIEQIRSTGITRDAAAVNEEFPGLPRSKRDTVSGETLGLRSNLSKKQEEINSTKDKMLNLRLAKMAVEKSLPLVDAIQDVLQQVNDLVNDWYKECKEIVESQVKENITRAKGMSSDDQRKYWGSVVFKKEVKIYYERWRALEEYCDKKRPGLRDGRRVAENYYTENLYPREAVEMAWKLAAEDTDEEIRALAEERKALFEEIRELAENREELS